MRQDRKYCTRSLVVHSVLAETVSPGRQHSNAPEVAAVTRLGGRTPPASQIHGCTVAGVIPALRWPLADDRRQPVDRALAKLLHKQLPRGRNAREELRQQRPQLTRQLLRNSSSLLRSQLRTWRCLLLQDQGADGLRGAQLLLVGGRQLHKGRQPAGRGGARRG